MFEVLQFPDSGLDCLFSVSSWSVPQSCFCVSLVGHVCLYSTFVLVKLVCLSLCSLFYCDTHLSCVHHVLFCVLLSYQVYSVQLCPHVFLLPPTTCLCIYCPLFFRPSVCCQLLVLLVLSVSCIGYRLSFSIPFYILCIFVFTCRPNSLLFVPCIHSCIPGSHSPLHFMTLFRTSSH